MTVETEAIRLTPVVIKVVQPPIDEVEVSSGYGATRCFVCVRRTEQNPSGDIFSIIAANTHLLRLNAREVRALGESLIRISDSGAEELIRYEEGI